MKTTSFPFSFTVIVVVVTMTTWGTPAAAFAPSPITCSSSSRRRLTPSSSSSSALRMANEDDLLRWARASRSAGIDDRQVELKRPLGLVLNEDDSGNVYVETVAPKGNAARTGLVNEGDIVTMCSATFGDQMWSTRGVGLTRVLSAIRIRAGPTVKLVFENPNETRVKARSSAKAKETADAAAARAQAKRDKLLKELEKDEKKLKKGFFGLF